MLLEFQVLNAFFSLSMKLSIIKETIFFVGFYIIPN